MKAAIRKSFLLGLGAASMTKAQAEKAVNRLVKSNHVSIREGKTMLRQLKRHVEKEGKRLTKLAQSEATRLAIEARVMSNKHMRTLNQSLKSMDKRLTFEGKKTLQKIMKQLSR